MSKHRTLIHQKPDGGVSFTRMGPLLKVAVTWPLNLSPGIGLVDLMRFHDGWQVGEEVPPTLPIGGIDLEVFCHDYTEWGRDNSDLKHIGEVRESVVLYPGLMSETALRYFGFEVPDADDPTA